ncbi:tetratricopeptide repeat protein [Jeotgalibaca sp. MA1X17-3]|uniref:tetratricopeptide repeat protein n=1 Tax=Jeotgalibaca sp. MA1X17-3 TaxID=2908211 RepID=UPI001F2035FE|nr:tetratricopeptide repeat protein [Jeotgalibaca sp. MA1X17-3]UJF14826.1 tetratricopeptide repeat protein [Jeotgalibaca sp. MA1X17-3]
MNQEAIEMFHAVRENNQEEATSLFKQSLEISRINHELEELSEFAEALHQAGFLEEAKTAYLLLQKMSPELEEWNLFIAEIYIDQNELENALDTLLEFDETSELYPHALLMLADAYQTMGLYEVSEHKLLEASKLLPDEPVIQYALGKLYQASGEYKKAIIIFKNLIEADTQDLWAENLQILLADGYNAIGNFEEAVDCLEVVSDEEHTSDSLFQLGFAYLQLKEFNRASQIIEDLLEKDPHYMSAYLYLSNAYQEQNLLDKALVAINKGIEVNPYQAEYYLEAAKLFLKLKDEPKAKEQINKAIGLEPELTEAVLLKGDLLLEQEEYEEVIEFLTSPVILAFPEQDWQLAKAYNGLEEFEKSADYYQKAYQVLFDDLNFLEDYMNFLQEEGNIKKLQQVLELALAIDPENELLFERNERMLSEDF